MQYTTRSFLTVVLVVTILLLSSNVAPTQADYVVIDWGDVVKLKVELNYQIPGNPTPQFYFDGFIYLYIGDPIPSELKEKYDKITVSPPYSSAFRRKIIGMREGDIREFTLTHIEAGILDDSGETKYLYGSNLLFDRVEFLEMLYDAKNDPIFELTLFHPILLIPLFLLIVTFILLYKTGYLSSGINYLAQKAKPRCARCGSPTNYICGNQRCRKTVCRSCFSKESGCPFCKHSNLKIKT
ncbi:MAG: hypothetical protein ACFFDI_33070 [Promethearchaeota archaeon]